MSKKIKIQITSWLNGNVLFEYEAVDNTIAKTVNAAVKQKVNLRYSDLRYSNLSYSNLSYSDLRGSNLRYSDLRYSDLRGSNLRGSDLRYSNLRGSDLRYSNLSYSDLRGSNLSYSNLRGSNLRGSNLSYSDLSYSDLRGSNLRGSDLRYSDLRYAKNGELAIATTRILPDGELIGYKKCLDDKIVKLRIPADAKRSHAFGRKCRAEFAEVLEITKGSRKLKSAKSTYDENFVYKVGEVVRPLKPFSDDWVKECASGIHFYITKLEAENHV